MTKPPVLKPKEVVSLLEKLGFVEVRQRDPIGSSDALTVVAQRFLFMAAGIFLLYCSGK